MRGPPDQDGDGQEDQADRGQVLFWELREHRRHRAADGEQDQDAGR
jgi:hypothetical protein